jgi:hypothetical protein
MTSKRLSGLSRTCSKCEVATSDPATLQHCNSTSPEPHSKRHVCDSLSLKISLKKRGRRHDERDAKRKVHNAKKRLTKRKCC